MTKSIPMLLVLVALAAAGPRLAALEEHFRVELPALENGDVNGDWTIDLSDAVALLGYLYAGAPAPVPFVCGTEIVSTGNGDLNGDQTLDVSDAVHLLRYLYLGGPEPVAACQVAGGEGSGAAAVKTPFTIIIGPFVPAAPPERVWVDDAGVSHIRRLLFVGPVAGDLVGTDFILYNENVDTTTGDGDNFGTFVFETVIDGRSGTFEGHFSGPIIGGLIQPDFVGQGTGELRGMKIMGTTLPGSGVLTQVGIVLKPGQ